MLWFRHFVLLSFALWTTFVHGALEYSKIEHAGCPENAYCQKVTGEIRQKWLNQLDDFKSGKLNETKLNAELQKEYGLPISNWAAEEASVLPRIIMWDSPCPQHKKEASKFYISEIFRKNLKDSEIKDYTTLYFAKAIGVDANKKLITLTIPRGEIPIFIENNEYYFLREDEGKYYGLLVGREGSLKVTKIQNVKELPKDAVCLKEQIDTFLREAPSPTFYQGYHCKDVWDKTKKAYTTMLFGWSCN
ncbi:hypothetical protein DOM21_07950 [Bacteriovorax stolpii]|uniref:Uncharacterized protein n=1 Tax=Bacteriovorax stolpii TaxID=960 RepID=A0A2K9NT09_BACTC|nr:hypothetical protein [Bacteriovorax stolpii]AUN98632.1 hypothetical protein C0V70_11070 [Bacteriovorax stolpii]QDK41388.1 hypothetical protein DOM21_07950 [Bacteriovorax stolpii]TDP55861.1 hypothetical protein C8D79_0918 [Bacteriovorax stolpii]